MRISIVSVFLLFLLGGAFSAFANSSPGHSDDLSFYETEKPWNFPALSYSDNHSNVYTIKDHAGKVILLNIWATWCKPCVEEMPALDRLARKIKERGLDDQILVLPLSLDAAQGASAGEKGVPAKIMQFYQKLEITHLPVAHDEKGAVFKQRLARALPTSFVITPDGKVKALVAGVMDWESNNIIAYLQGLTKE